MSQSEGRAEERSGAAKTKLLFGRAASSLGILVSVAGVFAINQVVPIVFIAITMGTAGYLFGARRLGVGAVVLAVVVMLFGLLAINGYVPGIDPGGVNNNSPT